MYKQKTPLQKAQNKELVVIICGGIYIDVNTKIVTKKKIGKNVLVAKWSFIDVRLLLNTTS